jgi:hypothetical protein
LLVLAIAAAVSLTAANAAAEPWSTGRADCAIERADRSEAFLVALALPSAPQNFPRWTRAAFAGLDCRRCAPATEICVTNPIRSEYVCAPIGSTRCASARSTWWCASGKYCDGADGGCR